MHRPSDAVPYVHSARRNEAHRALHEYLVVVLLRAGRQQRHVAAAHGAACVGVADVLCAALQAAVQLVVHQSPLLALLALRPQQRSLLCLLQAEQVPGQHFVLRRTRLQANP